MIRFRFNMATVLFLMIVVIAVMFGWYLIRDTVHAFMNNPFHYIFSWIKSTMEDN